MRAKSVAMTVLVTLLALPMSAAMTPDRWRSDIDYLGNQLPKVHPNLFASVSRDSFANALAVLKADVNQLTDEEINLRLQRVVAMAHDAHTELETSYGATTWFPLRLEKFGDELVVTKTRGDSAAACGMTLLAINGIGAGDVYSRVAELVSAENDQWVAVRAPIQMMRAEVLEYAGVTTHTGSAVFTFGSTDGSRFELTLTAEAAGASIVFAADKSVDSMPLYRRQASRKYWWTFDPDRNLVYIKYNSCADDPALPFSAFAKEILTFIDTHLVDRVVVDIRNNSGGNSSVVQPLITGLKQRTFLRGRLYAVVGRQTFSSGVMAAFDLAGIGATSAGEPSGGKPNSYGEVKSFTLPSSGLKVYHSTRYFRLTTGDPSSFDPELPVLISAGDFFSGRDPVLDAIAPVVTVPSLAPGTGAGRRRAAGPVPPRTCPQ